MSTKGAHSGMSGACDSKRPMSARPMKMESIQHVSMAAKRKGRSISPRLGVCANSVVRIDKRCCLRFLAAFARGISWLSALSSGCFGGKFIPGSDACSHLYIVTIGLNCMIVPFYCQQNDPDIHSLFVWAARGERKVRGHLALRQGSFAPCPPS